MTWWLTIIVAVLVFAIGFYTGVRYAYRNLLALWLARMTPKELEDLAERALRERPAD